MTGVITAAAQESFKAAVPPGPSGTGAGLVEPSPGARDPRLPDGREGVLHEHLELGGEPLARRMSHPGIEFDGYLLPLPSVTVPLGRTCVADQLSDDTLVSAALARTWRAPCQPVRRADLGSRLTAGVAPERGFWTTALVARLRLRIGWKCRGTRARHIRSRVRK